MKAIRSSALTAAALWALGAAVPAQAVIVYSGPLNLTIPNTFDGLFVNVLTGSTFSGPGFPTLGGPGSNYDFNLYGSTTWTFFAPSSAGMSAPTPVPASQRGYVGSAVGGPVIGLAPGTVIDGSSLFTTSSVPDAGATLTTGAPAIFGFRFRNENVLGDPTDDTVHYAWARVILTDGLPGTLVDYAFESTPLTAIQAAAVPEPGSWALMLAGAAGLAAWTRRRARASV
jgi:hypothetical protein